MKTLYEDFIKMVCCAMKNQPFVSASADYPGLYALAQSHHMVTIMYHACQDSEFLPENTKALLLKEYQLQFYKIVKQNLEIKTICDILKYNHIRHMMLKGVFLRSLYPKADMREMSDIDVLVDRKDLKRAGEALLSCGYTFIGHKGHHDVYEKGPAISVEMHETLLDKNRETGVDAYFKDVWPMAKEEEYAYTLTSSDEYAFLMAHYMGHFQLGGSGVRGVLDLWLYRHYHDRELDFSAIRSLFQRYHMEAFADHIQKIGEYWFGDGPHQPLFDELGEYILSSGIYGKTANLSLDLYDTQDSALKARWKILRKKVFLPADEMKKRSKVLEKVPILLPVGYAVRVVKTVIKNPGQAKSWAKQMNTVDARTAAQHQEQMKKFGIHR